MKPLKYDHHVHTKIRGHVHTHNPLSQPGRGRRTYGVEFKTQLVAACRIPGVSVASVAREHGINHKVLHRWMREVPEPGTLGLPHASHNAVPAFIELPITLLYEKRFTQPTYDTAK